MIYKILHRKLKIELHEPHLKRELRPSKWKAVQAPLLASVVLLLGVSPVVCSERGKAMQLHFSCSLTTTKFLQFYIDNFSVESRSSNFNSKEGQYSNRINYF